MAQADYVVANGTGAAVRSDLNGQLAAIVSNNSGATEPATMYAYQWWADTTAGLLKLRNSANSAWITMRQLDGEFSTVPVENGSAAAPSIYFKDSGTDSGFFSPGTDAVAISTAGTNRLHITSGGLVGIGNSGPSSKLDVTVPVNIPSTGSPDAGSFITARGNTASVGYGPSFSLSNSSGVKETFWRISAVTASGNNGDLVFNGYNGGADYPERLRITAGGLVAIGTTSPKADALLTLSGASGESQAIFFERTGDGYDTAIDGSTGALRFLGGSSSSTVAGLSEWARMDGGRLLIGTSTAPSTGSWNEYARIVNTGTTNNSAGAGVLALNRNTAATSITATQGIGVISFGDSAGNEFGLIQCLADANAGTNDYPGVLTFSTTADGAASPTERMRITNYGTLQVSNSGSYAGSNPTYHDFSANSPNDLILRLRNTSSTTPYGVNLIFDAAAPNDATRYFLNCTDTGALRATIRSNGGLANFSANNANLSDRNAKKDISPAADTWNCLKEWEIVNYRYKDQPDDADLNLGVIAQQVAESCPEVITVFQEAKEATEDAPAQEERLGVKEQQMYWMAIKALQEAQVRIEQLESKVAALESA
jgi:hypothetical protein